MSKPAANVPAPLPRRTEPFRFRIVHLVYVVTVLAAALATFGSTGWLPGLFVGVFWSAVFLSRSRPQALVTSILMALLGGCLLSLILPAFFALDRARVKRVCPANLKQIGLALHNYHDLYGSLPPAWIADAEGRPMHSWRVLILPFLEQGPLYDAYDFTQPWDGPQNRRLLNPMPAVYACPSTAENRGANRRTTTSYVAVVGPTTAWPGQSSTKLSTIVDGTSNTALVVECNGLAIPWLEPRDLELDDALRQLDSTDAAINGAHPSDDFFYDYFLGRHVLFADGSVHFASLGIGPETWSRLWDTSDGRLWQLHDLESHVRITRPRWGNWLRLGTFLLLTAFPTPWVWVRPRVGQQHPSRRKNEESGTANPRVP